MIERTAITGVILCGGAGSRYEGRDKPLQVLDGAPLVAHVQRRLAPQVASVVISCNRNTDAYARWGDAIVTDDPPLRGPLGGVLAAMNHAATVYLFVCPGDAPRLPTTLVERLAAALERDAADVALPHDGARSQHLFMLIRCSLAPLLSRYLDAGERSVHGFIEHLRSVAVDASVDARGFVNVNSAADLRLAELASSAPER